MKYPRYKIVFTLFFISIFLPKLVFGAEFMLNSATSTFSVGDQFEVTILLNTENGDANAFGGTITFPKNLLQLDDIRDGNSLVNFWVDTPAETADGVVFSGITPGGYVGSSGLILSLVFTAQATGQGNVSITDGQLLSNNGTGSPIPLTISGFSFSVAKRGQTPLSVVSPIKNSESPESFAPEVAHDPNIFNDKWFVAFASEDKGSGIEKYEVKETTHQILALSKWNTASSPYVLSDQNLHSYIYVKAIDKAGNERIEEVMPINPLPFYENLDFWFILIPVILFFWLYKNIVWKKHK